MTFLLLLSLIAVGVLIVFLTGGQQVSTQSMQHDSLTTPSTHAGPSASAEHAGPRADFPAKEHTLFAFDPNTADEAQLTRLGLRKWQVRNIMKYRAAGGVFRKKEDFARLYGLSAGQYSELEPYINISNDFQPASALITETSQKPEERRDTFHRPAKLKAGETIVLNTADTTTLQRVPGIGPYYAKEIARYGQLLGGYVSVEQLDEIDNFPENAKRYFVVQAPTPAKLNVNRLSLNELRRHPYINYYQARAITDYRRQHGPIQSLSDLRLLNDFPPEAIERLLPYVEY